MTHDVHSLESQRFANGCHLLNKPLHRPESGIHWLVGVATTQLIVEDYGTIITQCSERFQIVARRTWSTVEHKQRCSVTSSNHVVRDASAVDLYEAAAGLQLLG